jgi:hypothetical protein
MENGILTDVVSVGSVKLMQKGSLRRGDKIFSVFRPFFRPLLA